MKVQIEDSWEGWGGETIVKLTNGRYFKQAEYHYEYMYAHRPMATFDGTSLHVEGMSRAVRVAEIFPVVSRVRGEWTGWDGETVVELENGQTWQQDVYHYEYKYSFRPEVFIDGNLMQVEGMSRPVRVRRA
jgi:hypothetical protein